LSRLVMSEPREMTTQKQNSAYRCKTIDDTPSALG